MTASKKGTSFKFDPLIFDDCISMERTSGYRPFSLVDPKEFENAMSGSSCVDTRGLVFSGNNLEGKGLAIVVEQCLNSTDPNSVVCQPQEKIDAFVSGVTVETMGGHNHFDFSSYEKPI